MEHVIPNPNVSYLHGLALEQGEVKCHPHEEGLAFEALEGPQAAGRILAQKLEKKKSRSASNQSACLGKR